MGIKNKSKELMTKANVPVVPGYHGQEAAANLEALRKEAVKCVNAKHCKSCFTPIPTCHDSSLI